MRIVVITFIILIILISVWSWFHFTSIEIITSYYWENLIYLSNEIYIDNWNKAEMDMVQYIITWEDTRKLWIYFINQGDIDLIDASMRKLDVFIRNKNKDLAQAEIEQLRVLFNVIKENECLSLENVL